MPLCISCRGEYQVPPEKFQETGPQTAAATTMPPSEPSWEAKPPMRTASAPSSEPSQEDKPDLLKIPQTPSSAEDKEAKPQAQASSPPLSSEQEQKTKEQVQGESTESPPPNASVLSQSQPLSNLAQVYSRTEELPPYICARCGQSNEQWHAWTDESGFKHFNQFFFLSSPWGWLALLSFATPILAFLLLDFSPIASVGIALSLTMVLIFVNVALLYSLKDSLWRYDLVARVGRNFLPQLALLAIITFVLAVVFGLILGFMLEARITRPEVGPVEGLGRVFTTLMLAMTFVNVALSAMFMAGHDYSNWLNKQMPQPIYAQERRLLGVIEDGLRAEIRQVMDKDSKVQSSIKGLERTAYAGVILIVNTETEFKPQLGKETLKQLQSWRITADRWGRIQEMQTEGTPQYIVIEQKAVEVEEGQKTDNGKVGPAKEVEIIPAGENLNSRSDTTISVTSSRRYWTS
jgi:hypothetical protein